MNRRLELTIRGRVQGVGFRYFARREATRRGLAGYVRNLADGDVEVVAEGPEAALRSLRASLSRGPAAARVTGISERWGEPRGETAPFQIRP